MKVLLISANKVVEPYPVYPLGLDYVAGALSPTHEVRILDVNQIGNDAELEKAIAVFGPHIIGLSLRNVDNTDVLDPKEYITHYQRLTQTVRRACNAPIVLGGSGFTIFPRQIMRLLDADYGVVGEGERMAALLHALERNEEPAALPGILTRGQGMAVSDPGPWSQGVSRGFDPQAGHLAFYLKNGGMLNLQTKRGCPFQCVYCSYPHIEGRAMRRVLPEQVARTALELEQAGAKYLFVTDSAFNADVEHSLAVAQALRAAKVTIPWGGFFAPIALPRDYFKTLADCGLKHVEFGSEALCDAMLQAYRKPFNVGQVFEAHAAALAAGLHVAHYFLFGGPGETEQTLEISFSNIDKLEKTVLFLFCGMRIYPHTGLYDIALAQGQIAAYQDLVAPIFYQPLPLTIREVARRVEARAQGRIHWVCAAGGQKAVKAMTRMYRRGHSGPLWEYLIG